MNKKTTINLARLVVVNIAIIFGTAITGLGQNGTAVTVETGKAQKFRIDGIVINRGSLRYTITPPGLASINFDTNDTFIVKGLTPGRGSILITGTEDVVNPSGPVVARAFTKTVAVTVLPLLKIDSLTRRIAVSKGSTKTFAVGYLMSPGQEFYNVNANGITWKNLVYQGGSSQVATGELDRRSLKFHVTGVNHGKTTLTLLGIRKVANTWQRVERKLVITVGTGIGTKVNKDPEVEEEPANADPPKVDLPPPGDEGRDKIVQGMERVYADYKRAMDRPGVDDNEAQRILNDLKGFVAYAEERIVKEESGDDPTGPRWMKLYDLKEQAESDIRRLEDRLRSVKTSKANNAGGVVDLGEISWSETAESLNLADRKGKRFRAKCKTSPSGWSGTFTVGTDPFGSSTFICTAAQYSGLIDASGGEVVIEVGPALPTYKGNGDGSGIAYPLLNWIRPDGWPNEYYATQAPRFSFTFIR